MKKLHTNAVALAVAAALFGGGVIAQTSGTVGGTSGTAGGGTTPSVAPIVPSTGATRAGGQGAKDSKVARVDQKFMTKAAQDGMFELEAATIAANKATSPEVKSFASMMVADHKKTNAELMQLAASKGVEMPATVVGGKRRDIDKLNKLTGEKFDREFANEIGISAHKKVITLFEKQSKDSKDPELKAFVDKSLPSLRMHLDHAMRLPQNKGKG